MELVQKRNIRVVLKGIVVDSSTEVLAEDYDEWVCLDGASIAINGHDETRSDSLGQFGTDKVYDKNNVKELRISFNKDRHKPQSVTIPIVDQAEFNNICILVKMDPAESSL
jgi:hypothetical protein